MTYNNTLPSVLQKRPSSFLKFFLKVPVHLHRMGMGGWEWMIGGRWIFISTIGRKTGKKRYTMVDVIECDKTSDTYCIDAAYGQRANWFRNIQANPVFQAHVGRRKFATSAVVLSPEETGKKMVDFNRRRPAYTKVVTAMIGLKFKDEIELEQMGRGMMLM
jgi:deazaflavin-dependent oxidoreductase (nitroreductase family)